MPSRFSDFSFFHLFFKSPAKRSQKSTVNSYSEMRAPQYLTTPNPVASLPSPLAVSSSSRGQTSTERRPTEEIGPVISTEAIGFLGLPLFRPNKMRVHNATSRVLQLFVYDDANQTRNLVLMIHRSLLDFPSLVISLCTCSADYRYPIPHLATAPLRLSGQSYS